MDEKVYYWASVLFAGLSLALLVTNISMISGNRNLQTEVSRRASIITTGTNLVQLHQSLIQGLADAAVNKNDKDMRELLANQGITVKDSPSASPAASNDDNSSDDSSKSKKKK